MAGIFHRQWVQAELKAQGLELVGRRVPQGNPDKAARLGEVVADFFDWQVDEAFASLLSDAVNEHGGLRWITHR